MMRYLVLTCGVLLFGATAARAQLEATEIAPGLYRGRVPKTAADFEELHRMVVRTVLNIRGNTPRASRRERIRVEAAGLNYRHEPLSFHPLRDGSGDRALAAMTNEADYPMYVHCQVNRDRTSALVAAYRVRCQGWSVEAAEAETQSFGLRRFFIGLNRYVRAGGG